MKKTTTFLLVAGIALMATSQVYAADGGSSIMSPTGIVAGSNNGTDSSTGIVPIFTVAGDQGSGKIIAGAPGGGNIIAPAPGTNPGGQIVGKQQFVSTIHNSTSVQYTDLQGHFAAHAVARLAEAGILSSDASGAFQPTAQISRQDLKAWIQKAAGVTVQDANPNAQTVSRLEAAQWIAQAVPNLHIDNNGGVLSVYPYNDTQNLTDAERTALIYLHQTNIMVGDGQRHFSPNATLSRGEAAVLLDKVVSSSIQTGNPLSYDTVSGTLPDSVNALVSKNQDQPGLYTVVDNGARYVVVEGGVVPTGGYSVSVDNVIETAAGIFVHASLHNPDAGSMVPQIVSYPNQVMKITDLNKPIYLIGD